VTVNAVFRVDTRPYTAYDNPSLPVAAWIAQGGVAGDATAGSVFMNFHFKDDPQDVSEFFNLEQMSIDIATDANVEVRMETLQMDQLSVNRPASPQVWHLQLNGISGLATGAMPLLSNQLPLWLGSPAGGEGSSGLSFEFLNIDLRLYAITIQGYMWGPRSVLAPGGPQRPIGGLFG